MDGTEEIIRLAGLLRVSADAARQIAKLRPDDGDADRINEIAAVGDAMADELDDVANSTPGRSDEYRRMPLTEFRKFGRNVVTHKGLRRG